jgi:hypothetical protein
MEFDMVMMSIMNGTHDFFKPITTSTADGNLDATKRKSKAEAKIKHDNTGSESDSSEEQTIASLKKTRAKRQPSKAKTAPKKRVKRVKRSGAK